MLTEIATGNFAHNKDVKIIPTLGRDSVFFANRSKISQDNLEQDISLDGCDRNMLRHESILFLTS